MTEPTLLIVDDIENNRLALTMQLEVAGYDNVILACDGREALDKMREHQIDLVLLDIMMPEMDGYQVLEEMHSDTELRGIPTIMISAIDELDSVIRCVELGAVDYLTKPFNLTLLKARVDMYVELARYKTQEAAYLQRLEAEKKRADQLLGTLLPKPIARVLKANRKLAPLVYNDIAVLFCDIVGFTAYSERHDPDEVFAQLESLIKAFEELVDDLGMVKIKTIGDAFMATGGLLEDLDNPVATAIECAFGMVSIAERHSAAWQVRVGIDFGDTVAGIVGYSHYQFDVWGDTVNTAARIEAIGQPGTVNISGRGWQQVRNQARGRSLGLVDLKGKEKIEVIECQELT